LQKKISNNKKTIYNLEKTRDLLLPKLMTGKIRVKIGWMKKEICNQMVGEVVQKTKDIEYLMNLIIYTYLDAHTLKNHMFLQNVLLNSSIMSFGSKIKVIKIIEQIEKEKKRNLKK